LQKELRDVVAAETIRFPLLLLLLLPSSPSLVRPASARLNKVKIAPQAATQQTA
jgi:hypothetical protein